MKHLSAFVLVALLAAPAASAQRLAESSVWLTHAPLVAPTTQIQPLLFQEPPSDYRWHGLAIGFVALAALGAWIGTDACNNQPEPATGGSDGCAGDALTIGAIGGLIGATLGFLIGKGVPRSQGPQ